jgi:hypothetical protein
MWETIEMLTSIATAGVRYGFIPFMILYAMKKDPRISVMDVVSPVPNAPPEGAPMM